MNKAGPSRIPVLHHASAIPTVQVSRAKQRRNCFLLALLTVAFTPLIASSQQGRGSLCVPNDTPAAGPRLKFSLDANIIRGTDDADKYGAGGELVNWVQPRICGWGRQRIVVEARAGYDSKTTRNSSPAITRDYSGLTSYLTHFPGNKAQLSVEGSFLHSSALGLYLQQAYSARVGRQFKLSPSTSLELAAGPAFVGQNFLGPNESQGFAAASFLEALRIAVGKNGAELTQSVRSSVPLEKDRAWELRAQAQLAVPLVSRIGFVITVFDAFISKAPVGFEKNFFTTTAGIDIAL